MTRLSMAEAKAHHQITSFRNLCITYDIDDRLKGELEAHDCASIVPLTYISQADKEKLVKKLSIGHRSRINAAIDELQKLPTFSSTMSLQGIESSQDVDISKINHAKDFEDFCAKHNIEQDAVIILSKYDCCSLPALRHLPLSDVNELKYSMPGGQRAAFTQGITDLRGLSHSTSLPNMKINQHEERVPQGDSVPIQKCEKRQRHIHTLIPEQLHRNVERKQDFEDIKRIAKLHLNHKDVADCDDIRQLWDVFEKRGLISIGCYENFTKVLKTAELPVLKDIVEQRRREMLDADDEINRHSTVPVQPTPDPALKDALPQGTMGDCAYNSVLATQHWSPSQKLNVAKGNSGPNPKLSKEDNPTSLTEETNISTRSQESETSQEDLFHRNMKDLHSDEPALDGGNSSVSITRSADLSRIVRTFENLQLDPEEGP